MSNPLSLHPIPWYDAYGSFPDIFTGLRAYNLITPTECALLNPHEPSPNDLNTTTFKCGKYAIQVLKSNAYNFPVNAFISKFTLLSAVRFKNSHSEALSYIQHELMGVDIPYLRVGVDYFKIISKPTRYGGIHSQLKRWKKDEITEDHGKKMIKQLPKYDDFVIIPDNHNHKSVINNCYNLYSKFEHKPSDSATETDIPHTLNFLKHIFQDHYEYGLIYMKVLYEFPKQILPVLTLLSEDNETGKTTFINLLEMIFGDNYVLISPEMLTKEFNTSYATKNIIAIEEMFLDKPMGFEKIKSLSTGKSINVSRKFIDDNTLPFYGKVVMCTNRVKDFMRISQKEIRFWLREVPNIPGEKNINIERDMFNEIPKFLRFLLDLPPVKFDKQSRMVFSAGQLDTMALKIIKEESLSGLFKDISLLVEDFFNSNPHLSKFHASLKDIKDKWFSNNTQVSIAYIKKVLQDEAKIIPLTSSTGKSIKYYPFGILDGPKVGTPYVFIRQNDIQLGELEEAD